MQRVSTWTRFVRLESVEFRRLGAKFGLSYLLNIVNDNRGCARQAQAVRSSSAQEQHCLERRWRSGVAAAVHCMIISLICKRRTPSTQRDLRIPRFLRLLVELLESVVAVQLLVLIEAR